MAAESALPPRILLVEDEPSLVLTLTDRLVSEGYRVETAGDGNTALARAGESLFDLVVLDVMLPGKNGFDVCRDLRQRGVSTPVLMLTARTQVVDRVVGLKLGADDYLTKPFEMIELLARIEALLRRSRGPLTAMTAASATYAFGPVAVDFRRAEVTRDGVPLALSALELKLLRHLIENRGLVVSRDELLDQVWGYDASAHTRTVDVHVASLRQKVEPQPSRPQFIVTVHRLGYKFVG
ncbi:MAG TPA: response regulator transcription factor [Thermoanaerobaculia bacterium]|jgi:two-component system alkaline phosphatase synthesis response regulator PhoP|nr:response regulator transcription factor [Thermoanaerobaculia bacterium]